MRWNSRLIDGLRRLATGHGHLPTPVWVGMATAVWAAFLVFVPPAIFGSVDYLLFYRPNFHFLLEALGEGRPPLWNPYIGLGRPFLADLQNAVFYPPLYVIGLGENPGMFLLIWLHCFLAAVGMIRLAGALGIHRPHSYVVTTAFLTCGSLAARWMTGQVLYCCGLCYVPWLFACSIRTGHAGAREQTPVYALLLTFQLLSGHPQVFWISTVGQAVFITISSLHLSWKASLRCLAARLSRFGLALFWSFGLAAVVLLPFLELVRQGNRCNVTPEFMNYGRLRWADLGSLVQVPPPPFYLDWERNLFLGWPLLGLGLIGLGRIRDRNVRGLWGIVAAALIIAFGSDTPAFRFVHDWLPGFTSFRLHVRAAFLIVFALVCAGGLWLSQPHPQIQRLTTHVSLRYAWGGFVLAAFLALAQANWNMKRAYVSEELLQTSPRYVLQWRLAEGLQAAGLLQSTLPPPKVCIPRRLLPANFGMIHHYANVDAYTSLFLRGPWDYLHAVLNVQPDQLRNTSLSAEVFERGPFPYRDLGLAAGLTRDLRLVIESNVAPAAFLVFQEKTIADYQELLRQIPEHDLRKVALVGFPVAGLEHGEETQWAVANRRWTPNAWNLAVTNSRPALLVLTDAWYPGWWATIDGQRRSTLAVNGWMRAVFVPAGRHEVHLFYRQNYLCVGGLVSLICLGWLGLSLLRLARQNLAEQARAKALAHHREGCATGG